MKQRKSSAERAHGALARVFGMALTLLALCLAVSLTCLSCYGTGNATSEEREELLRAVRGYWEGERDYNPGTTSGVGEITYAEVAGDEAKVRVEIILGYTQPTEGAGYKETTFLLRKEGDVWKVTYDGWIGKDVLY